MTITHLWVALFLARTVLATSSPGCGFTLTSSGNIACPAGQLADGQIRLNGTEDIATFHISDGKVSDSEGKGCIITEDPITQIQCDLNKPPAGGFAVDASNILTYKGSSQFYACPATDTEYNIYVHPNFGQAKCFPITLTASGCGESSSSSVSTSQSSTTSCSSASTISSSARCSASQTTITSVSTCTVTESASQATVTSVSTCTVTVTSTNTSTTTRTSTTVKPGPPTTVWATQMVTVVEPVRYTMTITTSGNCTTASSSMSTPCDSSTSTSSSPSANCHKCAHSHNSTGMWTTSSTPSSYQVRL